MDITEVLIQIPLVCDAARCGSNRMLRNVGNGLSVHMTYGIISEGKYRCFN